MFDRQPNCFKLREQRTYFRFRRANASKVDDVCRFAQSIYQFLTIRRHRRFADRVLIAAGKGPKTMRARWSVILTATLILGGCSSSRQVWVLPPHNAAYAWGPHNAAYAWGDVGRQTARHSTKHPRLRAEDVPTGTSQSDSREAALALLPEYSREWVSLRKELDAAEDDRITRILLICKGC